MRKLKKQAEYLIFIELLYFVKDKSIRGSADNLRKLWILTQLCNQFQRRDLHMGEDCLHKRST